MKSATLLTGFCFLMAAISQFAAAESYSPDGCGSLANSYGPFDYTNPEHFEKKLPIVEQYHFNSGIELHKEVTTNAGSISSNLDYVLRAFPNHHRALASVSRYQLSSAYDPLKDTEYRTADCYFRRAIRWRPSDVTVRLIYGNHLYKLGQMEKAIEQYQTALKIDPNHVEAHYNIGLLYAKTGTFDMALKHAKLAYAANYPLPGLKNILQRNGQWK